MAGILFLLLVCSFPRVFFHGEEIAPGDFAQRISPLDGGRPDFLRHPTASPLFDQFCFFYPNRILAWNAIRAGEWPLWNHLSCGGMPLLANAQSAVLYPPHVLYALFEPVRAMTLCILLKLFLCGMSAYLCGRGLGFRHAPSVFLGIAWMLSSYAFAYLFWPLADVGAWVPILFLGVERALEQRYRSSFFLTTFAATLMLLAGHPETAFTMGVGVGFYFCFRLVAEEAASGRVFRAAGVQAAAWAAALLLSAAQLVPLLEFMLNSLTFGSRAQGASVDSSVNLSVMLAGWIPRFFGSGAEDTMWGSANQWDKIIVAIVYPGLAVWICASLAANRRLASRRMNRRAACLFLTCTTGLLMAFGAPPFEMLDSCPGFSSIRPSYFLSFAMFGLPLMAAGGLDAWGRGERSRRTLRAPVILVGLGAALTLLGYMVHRQSIEVAGMGNAVLGQITKSGLLAIVVLLLLRLNCPNGISSEQPDAKTGPERDVKKDGEPGRRAQWATGLLGMVLAIDLMWAAPHVARTAKRSDILPDSPLTDYLQSVDPPGRVMFSDTFIPIGLFANYGIEQMQGYDGIYTQRWPQFMSVAEIENLTRYWVVDERYPGANRWSQRQEMSLLDKMGPFQVYRNLQALPRVVLADRVQTVNYSGSILRWQEDRVFNPAEEVLLERPLDLEIPQGNPQDPPGHASVLERKARRVVIEAHALRPCVLLLLEAWYPGWKAEVDGESTEVFPAHYAFRGVALKPGTHTVEFRYDPLSFRIGLTISTVTLLVALAACLHRLIRGARGRTA